MFVISVERISAVQVDYSCYFLVHVVGESKNSGDNKARQLISGVLFSSF